MTGQKVGALAATSATPVSNLASNSELCPALPLPLQEKLKERACSHRSLSRKIATWGRRAPWRRVMLRICNR